MNSKKIKAIFVGTLVLVLIMFPCLYAQETVEQTELPEVVIKDTTGKFEVGVYYGRWSLGPILSSLEDKLTKELGREIRKAITASLNQELPFELYPDQEPYEEEFKFSSGGPNYGVELRFYPQGRSGAFSFGFSLDKVTIRISADEGHVRQDYQGGAYAVADGIGEIVLKPLFTTLSFRWDFKPAWRVTPYYTMGVGVAALDMDNVDKNYVSYEWDGEFRWASFSRQESGSDIKTLQQVEEEGETNIPNVMPLLWLGLGVRANITPNLVLKGEANFWDGFVFRFGIAGRF